MTSMQEEAPGLRGHVSRARLLQPGSALHRALTEAAVERDQAVGQGDAHAGGHEAKGDGSDPEEACQLTWADLWDARSVR